MTYITCHIILPCSQKNVKVDGFLVKAIFVQELFFVIFILKF